MIYFTEIEPLIFILTCNAKIDLCGAGTRFNRVVKPKMIRKVNTFNNNIILRRITLIDLGPN